MTDAEKIKSPNSFILVFFFLPTNLNTNSEIICSVKAEQSVYLTMCGIECSCDKKGSTPCQCDKTPYPKFVS